MLLFLVLSSYLVLVYLDREGFWTHVWKGFLDHQALPFCQDKRTYDTLTMVFRHQ